PPPLVAEEKRVAGSGKRVFETAMVCGKILTVFLVPPVVGVFGHPEGCVGNRRQHVDVRLDVQLFRTGIYFPVVADVITGRKIIQRSGGDIIAAPLAVANFRHFGQHVVHGLPYPFLHPVLKLHFLLLLRRLALTA
ncbi:hypothetical protein KKC1_26270, partial [Calderihabitans maritimus]